MDETARVTGIGASNDASANGRIMVVDDHEPNRLLLQDMLEARGYVVDVCAGGAEAIAQLGIAEPDLLLLDVSMPGIDGFEVCRRLRADPATESLPIILVTAFTGREQRLAGIEAGANDYLTKPIDRPELLLRVRNALQMRKLHRALADQYDQLRQCEAMRDALVHMMVHDLRAPLSAMLMYSELIRDKVDGFADHELTSDLEEMRRGVRLLTDMVSNVLDVNRSEATGMPVRFDTVDLHKVAAEAITTLGRAASCVSLTPPVEPAPVLADEDLLRRVLANLVGNAVKFTPDGEQVIVDVLTRESGAMVTVTDAGPGIPAEYHQRIFEKFAQVDHGNKHVAASTGLGLTFCKLAIEAHGGSIGVENGALGGSVFWFTLPTRPDD